MSVDLLAEVSGILEVGGIVAIDIETRRIVEHAAGVEPGRAPILESINPDVRERAVELATRRASGEPLQYLLGVAGFRHLDLAVGPGVFIPRPETETVVEKAIQRLPQNGSVVDIGTGCGAIALAIAGERPDATVHATELSEEAVLWTKRNMERTGLGVMLYSGDLFSPLPDKIKGTLDVVVSNPPYVPTEDAHLLPVDVVVHEPPVALFAGSTGLDVMTRLIDESRSWLRPSGWLVMEIGGRQDGLVAALLQDAGYSEVRVDDDLAGRPRIASAQNA